MRAASPAATLVALFLCCTGLQAREPTPVLPATGTIEYVFTPGDDAAGMIVRAVDAARSEVLVQAFSFTHEGIADALVRAARRGVDVRVIADADQTELVERNVVRQLATAGVTVLLDDDHLAAHNKVMVIDAAGPAATVVTGSFNFTFAAQFRNAENLLLLRGNPGLARAYRDNWMKHFEHAAPLVAP